MSFLDFCLHCDTQTSGGAYCSQRCRLLDMDNSPSLSASSSSPVLARRGSNASSAGFYLPPPFDFAAYRTPSRSTKPTTMPTTTTSSRSSSTTSRPTSLYSLPSGGSGGAHPSSSHSPSWAGPGALTASSSRSSLPAFESSWGSISRSAREELREYGNSFDTVRDLRRKVTMGELR